MKNLKKGPFAISVGEYPQILGDITKGKRKTATIGQNRKLKARELVCQNQEPRKQQSVESHCGGKRRAEFSAAVPKD